MTVVSEMYRLTGHGEESASELLWEPGSKSVPKIPTPLFYGERLFVLTWQPFQSERDAERAGDLTTQVEFRLSDHPEGTLLQLRETGFAALPGTLSTRTLSENTTGWDVEVLPRLRAYVEGGADA